MRDANETRHSNAVVEIGLIVGLLCLLVIVAWYLTHRDRPDNMEAFLNGRPHSPLAAVELFLIKNSGTPKARSETLRIDDEKAIRYIREHMPSFQKKHLSGSFGTYDSAFIFDDGSRYQGDSGRLHRKLCTEQHLV